MNTFELAHPFRVQIQRHGYLGKIACSHFVYLCADSKDIAHIMNSALTEAKAKFAGYSDMSKVMLFASGPLFLMDDRRVYTEAIGMVSQEVTAAADKIYALTSLRRITRLK